jgi:hypothetical protein
VGRVSLSAYLTALLVMREKRACLAVSSFGGLASLLSCSWRFGSALEPGEGIGEGVEAGCESLGWYCCCCC